MNRSSQQGSEAGGTRGFGNRRSPPTTRAELTIAEFRWRSSALFVASDSQMNVNGDFVETLRNYF